MTSRNPALWTHTLGEPRAGIVTTARLEADPDAPGEGLALVLTRTRIESGESWHTQHWMQWIPRQAVAEAHTALTHWLTRTATDRLEPPA